MDNVVVLATMAVVVPHHVAKDHVVLNIHLGRDIRMSAHLVAVRNLSVSESDVANTSKKCLF